MTIANRLKLFLASAVSLSLIITPTGVLAAEAAAAPAALAKPAQPDPSQAELAVWKTASASDATEDYKTYLNAYPAGKFAEAAKNRITALDARPGSAAASTSAAVILDVKPVDASAWQQEYALWQAASAGNTTAEYEAYLASYPAGRFAAVAQARIVQIAAAGTTAPGVSTDDKTASTSPGPVTVPAEPQQAQIEVETQVGAFMSDIGTAFTEAQFLDRNARREIQGRLTSIGYNTHGTDGAFGPRSRSAISAWQQDNGASATAFLSGSQIALIREQSATRYAAWLDAQAAARAAQPRRKIVVVERRVDNRAADAAIALGVMGAMLGVAGGLKHGHRHGRRCAPFAPC